jgi:[ribosomal protein S5]-alanine N-acetyltransferase
VPADDLALETARLFLRPFTLEDAAFILELLNEPSFLRNIGDKGVRTTADARRYIQEGPMASDQRFGFALERVELKGDGTPIGICGLLKRDALPDPDVGFALLPRYWSKGYAREAAAAVVGHARDGLRLPRVLAITSPDNTPSIALLGRLGFRFERMVHLPGNATEVKLFEARLVQEAAG